ncbi:hypothetical protein EUTSA_v10015552mg [Eutrema salsugineum]|uniref:Uncharacterized protein n=1 Tax=Eutrema salsugineum TaxID=72664 RepID=V4LKA3_EUTSA|nr:uncharacterized protein LOC18018491 [Eutrema salsugineum]ESQ42882.1 hypothetical protein EUTSA_v10015552mg [Eutrema salsugineum]
MKLVEKSDKEKHFSWCSFHLYPPLMFFLVTLVLSVAFLCFLSSYGFSSLLATIAILSISTFVFFTRFFKKKTRLYLAERSHEGGYNVDVDDDEDEDGLIEITLVSEEAETMEAMRNINRSRQRNRIDEDEELIDDVNMEDDNLIEIDISIGSIKRRNE